MHQNICGMVVALYDSRVRLCEFYTTQTPSALSEHDADDDDDAHSVRARVRTRFFEAIERFTLELVAARARARASSAHAQLRAFVRLKPICLILYHAKL